MRWNASPRCAFLFHLHPPLTYQCIRSQGNSEDFDELVRQFNFKGLSNDTPAPGPQLQLWISALSHVVSRLERTHSALPEAIIAMPWTTMDNQFAKSYTSFIGMLVSARPEYLSLVLGEIVQGLTYSACDCPRPHLGPPLTFQRFWNQHSQPRHARIFICTPYKARDLRPVALFATTFACPDTHLAIHPSKSSDTTLPTQAIATRCPSHLHSERPTHIGVLSRTRRSSPCHHCGSRDTDRRE